jgi:hypothetical protein
MMKVKDYTATNTYLLYTITEISMNLELCTMFKFWFILQYILTFEQYLHNPPI